jgi:hypothetical protein
VRDSAAVLAVAVIAIVALFATPAAGEGLRAGAASVTFRVPPGTPLAGYGAWPRRLFVPDFLGRYPHAFWFKPHRGVLDPPAARALVVEGEGSPTRLTWVAVDLIAVDEALRTRVIQRLHEIGVAEGTLILSASHTHSGPGALYDTALMAPVAVDRQDPAVRDTLVDSIIDAVRQADAGKVAARVGAATTAVRGLTTGRLGRPVDQDLVVLKVVSLAGRPVALVWNYAIHGTMLSARNLELSGDVMGMASRRLEATLGVPALFVNGAMGDVSPARHGRAEAEAAAETLASAVRELWTRTRPTAQGLLVAERRVRLPEPRLSLRNCLGGWTPAWLSVPLDGAFPRHARLTAGLLGDAAWVAIPGELQSDLGREIKGRARARHAFVASVSNGYAGYFVTATAYAQVAYVTCGSLYGREAGASITRSAGDLLASLTGNAGGESSR